MLVAVGATALTAVSTNQVTFVLASAIQGASAAAVPVAMFALLPRLARKDLSFDLRGRLLIANRRTNQILAADAKGRLAVAVEGDLQTPVGAVQLADGSYFVSNINGGVAFAGSDGRARTVSREFAQPGPGIGIADEDSVYVVDYGGTDVKQVRKDGHTLVVANGLRSPVGLVVSADRSTAVVADWGTNTAYGFRVPTT